MYVAIDLGGTKTLLSLFDNKGQIIKQSKFKTPRKYPDFIESLKENKDILEIDLSKVVFGAIGTRGILDRQKGIIITDNVLKWENAPIIRDCQEIFGCQFKIENDSKLAGLSEAHNIGDKFHKILYVTISTGIGSALIVDGKIDEEIQDSEIGKWIFEHEGKMLTWESFAGGSWITKKYGMQASELNDQKAWVEISKNLAIGFVDLIVAYDPDVIVIGGGVGTHFDKYKDELLNQIKTIMPDGIIIPKIVKAKNPEQAVIYGCYQLIRQ